MLIPEGTQLKTREWGGGWGGLHGAHDGVGSTASPSSASREGAAHFVEEFQSFQRFGASTDARTSTGLLVLGLSRRATRARIRASSVSDLKSYLFSLGLPRKISESKMKFWPEGSIMTWILSLSF
jgi:hypothetical protein